MPHDGQMMWGWAMGMGLIGLVVTLALIGVIVWAVINASRSSRHPTGQPTALDILDERLARGEISPEEYQERRDLIRRGRP